MLLAYGTSPILGFYILFGVLIPYANRCYFRSWCLSWYTAKRVSSLANHSQRHPEASCPKGAANSGTSHDGRPRPIFKLLGIRYHFCWHQDSAIPKAWDAQDALIQSKPIIFLDFDLFALHRLQKAVSPLSGQFQDIRKQLSAGRIQWQIWPQSNP